MQPRRRTLNAHKKRVVAARAEWKCELCGILLDEAFEVDHIVQFALGGTDDLDNCRALCRGCHGKVTVRQEMERLARLKTLAARSARPPMICTRCEFIVSPYFVHVCKT